MMGSSPSSSARIDPRRGSNTIGGTKSDRSGGGTESLREETETQTSASTSAQSRSHGSSSTSRPRASPAELLRSHLTRRVPPMSTWSSAPVENSSWASNNFLLGAGMVVLQPSTMKVAIVYDSGRKTWFLPRGRKDIGESLEATALREAYEEVREFCGVALLQAMTRLPCSLDIKSSLFLYSRFHASQRLRVNQMLETFRTASRSTC
ncbi:unnamed protein product [Mycena citricolor]|uniref:Nudix hydrolase domain-containing protein n=1 Tax=Mycena citricolor TaxID=2018698 RepID=A0AAD2HB43_9AGAR|nr:unnamed protein product [Mycena citricolor]